MEILKKELSETTREYALRVIRHNIMKLEIAPGSMISEQEVAQTLEISRTPVHEALLELSKSKIVDILPQRGCLVSMIDFELVTEAVFLRRTVECAVVREACTLATDKDFAVLDENIRLQDFYLASHSYDKVMELDNQFHRYLYEISNKMQCYYMVELLNIHFDRLRDLSLYSVKNLKIIDDHKELLAAMRLKTPDKAEEILRKHLSRFEIDRAEIKEKFPQYFTR